MTKSELIKDVAERAKLSKASADLAVHATLASIVEKLSAGQDVTLAGFGTFTVKHRAAREGRNPKTGEAIQIPAQNGVHFKAGKGLKDSVN